MKEQLQGTPKILLSKKNASILLGSILTVSGVNIWKGVDSVFNNPQFLTQDSLHQIYERGYNREPYVTINGNYNYQFGMFSVLLNIGISILATELLLKLRGKHEVYEPVAPISLQPTIDNEAYKKEQKLKAEKAEYHEFRKDALSAYVSRILIQNPLLDMLMSSNVDVCVGEPSAGKSRFASVLAVCKAVKRGESGTAIDTLDTQEQTKNIAEKTWISGDIHTSVTSRFLELLRGKGRNKRSPYRAFIIDEVNKIVSNPDTSEVLNVVYKNAKEELRNQNMGYILSCHTLKKSELTDGSDDMANLRVSLLRSACILYFPSTRDHRNKPIKSDVVFYRAGYVDGIPLPSRVNNSNRFNDVGDWEMYSIPDDLDPSVMSEAINVQLAALGLNPMYASAGEPKADKTNKVKQTSSLKDTNRLDLEELKHDFGNTFRVYNVTQIKKTSLTDNEQKFVDNVSEEILNDESQVDYRINGLNIFEVTNGVILKCFNNQESWQNTLQSLSDRNIGKLSKSGKYWIHPVEHN